MGGHVSRHIGVEDVKLPLLRRFDDSIQRYKQPGGHLSHSSLRIGGVLGRGRAIDIGHAASLLGRDEMPQENRPYVLYLKAKRFKMSSFYLLYYPGTRIRSQQAEKFS